MIRLLIIVLALVGVLGAGAGGLVHFAIIPDFSGGIISSLVGVVNQEQANKPEEHSAPAVRPDPVFMTMEPILIPVIKDGVLRHNVYIAIRLELEPGKEEAGKFYMSRLHDLYLRALFDTVQEQQKDRDTLDIPKLKERLMVVTGRAVEPGVVRGLLVMSAFNR